MHQSESSKERRGLEVTPELDFQHGCCLNAYLMSHKMAPRFFKICGPLAYVIKSTFIAISLEKAKKSSTFILSLYVRQILIFNI